MKAWYEASTRTIGVMTGKTDTSSVLHELFHDWSRSMKDEHVSVLERHFGKRGTEAYEERAARAFERYMYDGIAPNEAVREVFEAIRTALMEIYKGMRRSQLVDSIHPEVRTVFDEMLGGKSARLSGALGSRRPVSQRYRERGFGRQSNVADLEWAA